MPIQSCSLVLQCGILDNTPRHINMVCQQKGATSMLTRVRRLIAPPVFAGEEEQTQAAEVLNAVLLAMLLGCVLYVSIVPLVTAIYLRRLAIAGVLILWLLSMLLLMRRGRLRLASGATVVGLWAILTFTAAADGGVRSLAFGCYMIVVLGAGLLLGLRPAIGVAIASAATGLVLLYAVRADILPRPTADRGDTAIWLVQSINLLVAAALLGRAIRSLNRALDRARRELDERRQAEAALRQSDTLLRGIIDNTPALIYVKRPDGRFLLINRQFEKSFDATYEQIREKTDYDFFPREVADVFRANDQQVFATGVAVQFEEYTPQASGRHVYISVKFPLLDAANQPYAVCGISTDITDRQAIEVALRESELRYRTLVEKMAEGLIQVDNDDVIQFVNDSYCEMTGYTRAELIGQKAAQVMLISEEDRRMAREKNRLRMRGRAERYEIQLRKKSGEVIWVEVSGAPIVDASGAVIGSIGVDTDITARKRAEAALQESEERHRVVSELVSDYAFSYQIAADGTVTLEWVTDAMTRITGYTRDEMSDLTAWRRVTHPEDISIAQRRRERLHAGQSDVSEYRMFAKDGRIVWLRYYSHPVWDAAQGRVARVYGVVQDITQLKLLEQQLAQAQKMEAVGQLAGGVAHDFNNILTIILSSCDLIFDELEPNHHLREDVGQIQGAAGRAAELTQQLLAFSRQQILQPHILNLNDVVAAMEKLLRPLIGEHIQLLTRLQPGLDRVNADPGRIEQVVMNLAINARDAMPDGGTLIIETANAVLTEEYVRAHVDVRAGAYVVLAISDTGSGMDAATRARIFEPFFTTKAQGKGTGLGLATVYGIVNQSGGHIWVYSELGHGTTFKVYLPQVNEVPTVARRAPQPVALPRGSATILLVEDEQVVRELASRILRQQGYRILEAVDGPAALRVAAEHAKSIDLLLTDVVMPGGFNGRQLAEQLLSKHKDIKVLYMSGYTDDAITHYGVLRADVACLEKPFTSDGLIRKVAEVLNGGVDQPPNGHE
jgi:two-component system, cell cycle sensor histidine kinase and response regulator CckA